MTSVLFKTDFEGDIRRMSLPEASFAKLKNVLSELYGLSDFSLKYTDEDNELITIASDLELSEAVNVAKLMGVKAIRLSVLKKETESKVASSSSTSASTTTEKPKKKVESSKKRVDKEEKTAEEAERAARKAEKEARKAEKEKAKEARKAEKERAKEARKAEKEKERAAKKAAKAAAKDTAGAGAAAPEVEEAKATPSPSSTPTPDGQKEQQQQPLSGEELKALLFSLLSDPSVLASLPAGLTAALESIDPSRGHQQPLSSRALVEAFLAGAPELVRSEAVQRLLPVLEGLYEKIDVALARVSASDLGMARVMLPALLPALLQNLSVLPAILGSQGGDLSSFLPFLAPFLSGCPFTAVPAADAKQQQHPAKEEDEQQKEPKKQQKKAEEEDVDAPAIHANIICDGCGVTPLRGIRYKCSVCRDYDLCEACEARDVHPQHALLKMRKAVTVTGPSRHGHGHHGHGPRGHHGFGFGHGFGGFGPFGWRGHFARAMSAFGAGEPEVQADGKQEPQQEQQQPRFGPGHCPRGFGGFGPFGHGGWHHHHRRPRAEYVNDVCLPDGMETAPGQHTKAWTVRNVGRGVWPEGVKLLRVGGPASVESAFEVPLNASPAPGETVEIRLPFTLPNAPGRYTVHFRLATKEGVVFGPRLWLDLTVKAAEPAAAPVAPAPAPAVVVEEVKTEAKQQQPKEETTADAAVVAADAAAVAAAVPSPAPAPVAAPVAPAERQSAVAGKWAMQLSLLSSMGFTDASLNAYMLERYKGNVQQVVEFLLGGRF